MDYLDIVMTYPLYQNDTQILVDPLSSTQQLINALEEDIFNCLFSAFFLPESVSCS